MRKFVNTTRWQQQCRHVLQDEEASSEDQGTYGEGDYVDTEYLDDPAGQEGADGDSENDLQDSELQGSDLQDEVPEANPDTDVGSAEAAELAADEEELVEAEEELADDDLAEGDGADIAEADNDHPVSSFQLCGSLIDGEQCGMLVS